ncbi:hypothetical protein ACFLTP_09150 [Chloroflexota bacterium]
MKRFVTLADTKNLSQSVFLFGGQIRLVVIDPVGFIIDDHHAGTSFCYRSLSSMTVIPVLLT